jgi:hypothetical protein
LAIAETGDYTQIDDRVAGYLDSLPALATRLEEEGTVERANAGALDVTRLELAQHLIDGEFLDAAGQVGNEAMSLGHLLQTSTISTGDLVLLASREHYLVDEHLEDRCLCTPT